MAHVVGGRKDFRLVDIVDFYRFENPRFRDVADTALGHDRNRHDILYSLDHCGVAHARDAARRADVGGDALERHHGARAGRLGDFRLLGRRHIHYDAALEHLGEIAVEFLPVGHCWCSPMLPTGGSPNKRRTTVD